MRLAAQAEKGVYDAQLYKSFSPFTFSLFKRKVGTAIIRSGVELQDLVTVPTLQLSLFPLQLTLG